MTYTYTTTTTGTLSIFGSIQEEKIEYNSGIVPITGFGENSSNNSLVPFLNPTRQITISGTYVDTGPTTIKSNFINQWNSIVNSGVYTGQENGTYNSDLFGTLQGKIMSLSIGWQEGKPTQATYTITFIEGTD